VHMNQITVILQNCIEAEKKARDVVQDHSDIRNLLMFNQELIFGKKWKPIHRNSVLGLEERTFLINLWGHNGDFESSLTQIKCHLLDEYTPVRRFKIRIRITQKQDGLAHTILLAKGIEHRA
jgi:hypothetical protein